MERQCWTNVQYSREECLEVVGISASAQKNELKENVPIIFKKIGSEVSPRDIEACHPLKKDNDRVIVKFSKMQEVGLPVNRSIFINTCLCPYYCMLWSKCKRIHDLGKISNFHISSGTIKVKVSENRNPISITHTQDF